MIHHLFKRYTYVSAKHSASSAFANFQDMMRVCTLPEFATRFQTNKHEEKKVVFVTVDGGPDENPRYEKNYKLFN